MRARRAPAHALPPTVPARGSALPICCSHHQKRTTMTMHSPALEATGVTVAYQSQSTPVLRELSLRVARGEIYALLGGNGAGKSTTMNTFLGFTIPSAGNVRVCGIDVAADPLA